MELAQKTIVFLNILRFKHLAVWQSAQFNSPLYLDYNGFLLKLNQAFLHW